jgi:hypothetical protein
LRQPQRALKIAKAVIVPEFNHVISEGATLGAAPMIGINAMIAKASHDRCEAEIIGDRHAAFGSCQMLYRVKRKG